MRTPSGPTRATAAGHGSEQRIDRTLSLAEGCRVERRGYRRMMGRLMGGTMDSTMGSTMDGRIKVNNAAPCERVGEPK
jgi:hypothetical protein